jgi:sn-glycerol 3-phosphate transport system ATP-binding protein
MNFYEARISDDGRWVVVDGSDRFPLPEGVPPAAHGQRVTLGIRPEHLQLAHEEKERIPFTVNHVEILGADTLVYGHFGPKKVEMTLRLADIHDFAKGTPLDLFVGPDKLHLFDPRTHKRIANGRAA